MGLKDKIDEVLDKTEIDDKIVDGVKAAGSKIKEVTNNLLDKTEIDDKIVDAVSNLKNKITGKDDEEAPAEAEEPKEE